MQTNDPERPTTQLIVTANVVVDVEVIPPLLRFLDEQLTAQVTLKNYTNTPVELGELQADRYVKVSVSSMMIPAKGEVVLTAELLPDEIPEPLKEMFRGLVEIKSNLTSMPIIRIPLWGMRKTN